MKRAFLQQLIWSVVFCCISVALSGQVSFESKTNAKQVVKNGSFTVSFTLRNAEGTNLQAPPFKDFRVLSGPNRAISTQINNGVARTEKTFSYNLMPKRTGTFTIGSASVVVNGKTFITKPLRIEVVAGKDMEEGEEQVYVEVIPSVQEAFVGQQIVIDYKLFTTVNVDSYNVIEESDYPGFFAKDVKRFDSRVIREVKDGVQYVTKIIKRVALFPQQTGTLTIEPMLIQLGIVKEGGNRRPSLFFNRNIERINFETQPLDINVKTLPVDAPSSFSGAVGTYRVSMNINRSVLTTDDVLTLKLNVQGNGDVKRIQAPTINFPEVFDVYDPKIKEESTYEINGEVVGKKEIEYVVLPKKAGTYSLNPKFSYFNPDSAAYITPDSKSYTITIRQGSTNASDPSILLEEEETVEDIKYIKLDTKVSKASQTSFLGSPIFWVLSILPFFLLGGVYWVKRMKEADLALDPALRRKKQAQKMAQKRLAEADKLMKASDSRAFYDEVSKAMLGYVCDKLSIPRSELSKNTVKEKLETLQVQKADIDRFMKIIHNCEMALFAGMDNADAMQDNYQNTIDTLATIEEHVGKDK